MSVCSASCLNLRVPLVHVVRVAGAMLSCKITVMTKTDFFPLQISPAQRNDRWERLHSARARRMQFFFSLCHCERVVYIPVVLFTQSLPSSTLFLRLKVSMHPLPGTCLALYFRRLDSRRAPVVYELSKSIRRKFRSRVRNQADAILCTESGFVFWKHEDSRGRRKFDQCRRGTTVLIQSTTNKI